MNLGRFVVAIAAGVLLSAAGLPSNSWAQNLDCPTCPRRANDINILNSNFSGTDANLFDFNDGAGNIVANNLTVDVTYNDGSGNQGETVDFAPTDPGVFVP